MGTLKGIPPSRPEEGPLGSAAPCSGRTTGIAEVLHVFCDMEYFWAHMLAHKNHCWKSSEQQQCSQGSHLDLEQCARGLATPSVSAGKVAPFLGNLASKVTNWCHSVPAVGACQPKAPAWGRAAGAQKHLMRNGSCGHCRWGCGLLDGVTLHRPLADGQ